MTKRTLILSAAIFAAAVSISGCKSKSYEKVDLTSIHTESAQESETETMAATTAAQETKETVAEDKISGVSASLTTYTSGKISIQYPLVSYPGSTSKETAANQLLKDNALSVLKGYGVDEEKDSLEVECKIISMDRRRITAEYTGLYSPEGAAHPVNLFFTNTIDFDENANVRLTDYCDSATLADYLLSDQCQLVNVEDEYKADVLASLQQDSKDYYVTLLNGADFSNESSDSFPEAFSYEKQGLVYFSVPVIHALGDYVVIKYTPETK